MAARKPVQLLIKARWILPILPARKVFSDCAVAVMGGRIEAILPWQEADKQYSAEQTLTLDRHILMPGLVNCHGHAAMSLLRGYADDYPLDTWLNDFIWPAEKKHVDADFVRDGTELAIAEMIHSGTTCFADMYFFPEQVALAAKRAHMRSQITFPVLDFATTWGDGPSDYIAKGLELHDEYRADDLIRIGFGPHAPYTVSDNHLKRIAVLAEELQAPIQIHLHETAKEVADSIAEYGMRPIERINKLGLLTPRTQCVHMTQIDDSDLQLLTSSGAHVIHCPESNLKLASGFCPVNKLINNGSNIALGTDGAASNNDLNMFGELETTALLAKGVSGDPATPNAHDVLAMATINGAKALGMDDDIGSIEVGKSADIIALETDPIGSQPLYDIASSLAYNNRALAVTHSWVAGRALMLSSHLQTLNERDIASKALAWSKKINAKVIL
ncbi:TRZ/ATZ family hydrolase [Gilvimarinus sp. SDUM040013]|uniref:TRZ/ATZ family hydrolase n=1 Tax=Gilvimarinus gilvus TaxID=3058038 RepID=A0ABU4RXL2_9GAMM|nr:TRZ/ATZ family hydrolase [Gilvimarinus sp. SDUM040013]MDO3385028.1 TRZ/ATZ family hydrolase [Gilvimarinus sp. SDUM040013]MDX6848403.1 TRZ/ATZ family hydrolase [Gilvimarinus sp. SDUM040013]